mmetsp:Transcript_22037/g.74111  ORF Transcript_22037/g.74111 Transcript_22037/m.74111 type:complete len:288 (+) Transcript_22037:62-925(+)
MGLEWQRAGGSALTADSTVTVTVTQVARTGMARSKSEYPVANVLELFGHLLGRAIQVLGDGCLRLGGQGAVLLAQVAVGRVLDRVEGGAVEHVVPAAQRGRLLAKVHLQVLEEVYVVLGGDGQQRPHCAHVGHKEDALGTPRGELHALEAHYDLAHVVLGHQVRLIGRAVQVAVHVGRVGGATGLRRQAEHEHVAELVRSGHRVVVQLARGGEVPRDGLVGEHGERVVLRAVAHPVEGLGGVADDDALVAHHLDGLDHGGQGPRLALAQEPLLAQVVQPQGGAHPHE